MPMDMLREAAGQGLEHLLTGIAPERHGDYRDRLAREMESIEQAGVAGLFLLWGDIARLIRERDLLMSPGRGRATSFLVLRLLGVTGIDPVAHGIPPVYIGLDRPFMPFLGLDVADDHLAEVAVAVGSLCKSPDGNWPAVEVGPMTADAGVPEHDLALAPDLLAFGTIGGLPCLRHATSSLEALAERGQPIDLEGLGYDDPEVFWAISGGTVSSHLHNNWLDFGSWRDWAARLEPDSLSSLALLHALCRPGPSEVAGDIASLRRTGVVLPTGDPLADAILRESNGIVVYEEQVALLLQNIGGFNSREADIACRASRYLSAAAVTTARERFLAGAAARGMDDGNADRLGERIFGSRIGRFLKCHAFALATLDYRLAWLDLRPRPNTGSLAYLAGKE